MPPLVASAVRLGTVFDEREFMLAADANEFLQRDGMAIEVHRDDGLRLFGESAFNFGWIHTKISGLYIHKHRFGTAAFNGRNRRDGRVGYRHDLVAKPYPASSEGQMQGIGPIGDPKRVLHPDGRLRMLEHVRSQRRWKAAFQDRVQPVWTRLSGGCRPNRETERAVERAGFAIETDQRRAQADLRLFSARPVR